MGWFDDVDRVRSTLSAPPLEPGLRRQGQSPDAGHRPPSPDHPPEGGRSPRAAPTQKPGDQVTVAVLNGVRFVDVTGVTKGRGWAGTIKRGLRPGARPGLLDAPPAEGEFEAKILAKADEVAIRSASGA